MAINQNHLFEDLNGVKCAVVEKNVVAARADFLRQILEYNHYTVVVVPSPPPKAAAPAPPAAAPAATPGASSPATSAAGASAAPAPAPPASSAPTAPASPAASVPAATGASAAAGPAATPASTPAPAPETFTVGVTDVMFNAINAIFGRLLKAPGGHVVTLAYWQQKENQPNDEKPYFDK